MQLGRGQASGACCEGFGVRMAGHVVWGYRAASVMGRMGKEPQSWVGGGGAGAAWLRAAACKCQGKWGRFKADALEELRLRVVGCWYRRRAQLLFSSYSTCRLPPLVAKHASQSPQTTQNVPPLLVYVLSHPGVPCAQHHHHLPVVRDPELQVPASLPGRGSFGEARERLSNLHVGGCRAKRVGCACLAG